VISPDEVINIIFNFKDKVITEVNGEIVSESDNNITIIYNMFRYKIYVI